jgi:Mlc titration factor MtfA (ptsG expression regulator)
MATGGRNGGEKTGGRVKGTQNRLTKTFKELLADTISDLQNDKKANLKSWAKENPTEFYKIAAKLIPTEVTGNIGLDVKQVFKIGDTEIEL